MKEIHLGDGAYARYDGSELVIYTSNGIFSTNSVFLEGPSIRALVDFLKVIQSGAISKTSGCESPQGPPVHDSACLGEEVKQ